MYCRETPYKSGPCLKFKNLNLILSLFKKESVFEEPAIVFPYGVNPTFLASSLKLLQGKEIRNDIPQKKENFCVH